MLALALLAAIAVYGIAVTDRWFYDDADYVLNDPRLESLRLFSPLHWHEPPPPLPKEASPDLYLPGYDKPLIADRYVWRLSFALERALFGESYSATHAHTINLLLHLACVGMLFIALRNLLRLYSESFPQSTPSRAPWHLWPGLAALIFAIHPWAAEPVCYVSARNGSLGALFSLSALALVADALRTAATQRRRIVEIVTAALLCLLAYGSKENFIVAPAAVLLACWPVLWKRMSEKSRGRAFAISACGLLALLLLGYAGVRGSERAAGLFAQTKNFGGPYLLEIQSPILLMILLDQLPCMRLSLETGHPGWPLAACWLALALNGGLVLTGIIAGRRRPALLGLAVFYVLLLPTNSFLPRPDFLAARNVYLPCAAIAAVFSGALIFLASRQQKIALIAGGVLLGYWAITAHVWAGCFADPQKVWARSARVAPEHATVRLNHAVSFLKQPNLDAESRKLVEAEANAALAVEDSPTMRYHTARPRTNRRAVAYRLLAELRRREERYAQAVEFIQKSWQESNNLETWLLWADLCYDDEMQEQSAQMLSEGLRVWPHAWWPRVMRGLFRGRRMAPEAMTHDIYSDLLPAENAGDSPIRPLRALQVRVLGILAQSKQARERAASLVERMSRMGVPAAELEELQKAIQSGD